MSDFSPRIDALADPVSRIAALLRASDALPVEPSGALHAGELAADVSPAMPRDAGERLLDLDVWRGDACRMLEPMQALPGTELAECRVELSARHILAALG